MSRIIIGARGDSQKAILNYLEANASDVLVAKINSGAKSMDDCWDFIVECARKELKEKDGAILDAVVFGWAVHFFEEDALKPKAPEKIEVKTEKKVSAEKCQPAKPVSVWSDQITLFDLEGAK